MTRKDIAEAARLLRGLLELVERGELEASQGHATVLLRRIEGAAVALEVASR